MKKKKTVISAMVIILTLIIVINFVFSGSVINVGESSADTAQISRINPRFTDSSGYIDDIVLTTNEPAESTKPVEKKETTAPAETTKPTEETKASSTSGETKPLYYATAIPPKVPASYEEQWNAGYLVAIDNPDKTYECAKVKLTDEDRDLLERLCYGEFGSGGFIGAALIAQCVKDAMCFDGYPTVESVIKYCRYDGRTDRGTTEECRQAVSYIFDQNKEAVQHRMMYMYNPQIVYSSFHESQNYIMSYQDVRFFDRWGY